MKHPKYRIEIWTCLDFLAIVNRGACLLIPLTSESSQLYSLVLSVEWLIEFEDVVRSLL